MLQMDKVINLKSQGMTYKQIANALGITVRTVSSHIVEYNRKHNLTDPDRVIAQKASITNPQKLASLNDIKNKISPNVPEHVPYYWDKTDPKISKLVNVKRANELLQENEFKDNLLKVIEKVKPVKVKLDPKKGGDFAIKGITTDHHLGMLPDSVYSYGIKQYKKNYEKYTNSIIDLKNTYGKADICIISNLGDEQDGWDAQTTRGGHELEQDLTNTEVFEASLQAKVNLIHTLLNENVANKIILQEVVNSNHSGDFSHLVALSVKNLINALYSKDIVEIDILSNFIEHRIYGDHCFIITHGKDTKFRRRGLPYSLNPETINFINKYINQQNITSKFIHLEKGDLHKRGLQECDFFDYRNYTTFAPPSQWINANFGHSSSGYATQIVPKHEFEIIHKDYILDYKTSLNTGKSY